MASILTSLNAGSGIDVQALTEQLLSAEQAPRQAQIDSRLQTVDAQISALGQFRSALDTMVSAVASRVSSGELSGQPAVSDASVLELTVGPGASIPRQSVEVRQLAQSQALASAAIAATDATFGDGTILIRFGSVAGDSDAGAFTASGAPDLEVTLDGGSNSLEDVRDAINRAATTAGAAVSAQLITDTDGTRLVLRGATGASAGFTVETSGDSSLDVFAFAEGTTGGLQRTQSAADAIVALDGLEIRRSSNTITDLIPGGTLTLNKPAIGQPVAISAVRSATSLAQTVEDVASALNQLKSLGDTLTKSANGSSGALSGNIPAQQALRALSSLTSVQLLESANGAPTRLADIGITIDRNGQFSVDSTRLEKAVTLYPAAVEAMITALNAKAADGKPAGPLRQIATNFSANGTAGASLESRRAELARQQEKLDDAIARKREIYTRQFSALDRAVNQSKALQSYLQQQIDLWTKSDN